MENIQKAITATQEKNAIDFKTSIQNELSSRLYAAINSKKEQVSKTLNASEQEETSEQEVATQKQEELAVSEANVIAPSAPTTGAKAGTLGSERSNAGGVETADPLAAMKAVKPYIDSLEQQKTESFENFAEKNLNEKVELDGRTKIFKTTLARLESARKLREVKNSVKEGMSMPSMTLSMSNKKMLDAINMKSGKFVMGEEDLDEDQEAYRKFFVSALKKFGVSSPSELSGDKKKELFNYIKKNWKG
jgi:hypothetical protein